MRMLLRSLMSSRGLTGEPLLAIMFVGYATGADAASIVFSDRPLFNLAAQPDQFENFDGPTPPCVIVSTNCHLHVFGTDVRV